MTRCLQCRRIPGHPFNAERLDLHLQQFAMPDRDAVWSTYLHYTYGEHGPVDRLLDWATSHRTCGPDTLDDAVVSLSMLVLAWMFTSSNRFVRDRATKGLVSLLSGRLDIAGTLVERFHDVDDPYVAERVYAVAYGVAMRQPRPPSRFVTSRRSSTNRCSLDGEPPPHILLRTTPVV